MPKSVAQYTQCGAEYTLYCPLDLSFPLDRHYPCFYQKLVISNHQFNNNLSNYPLHYNCAHILKKWYDNLPYDMIDSYAENFSKLKAFKMDWGKHDNPVVYVSCRMFSEKLEALGIEHYSEEFIGNHGNKLWSLDGRMINDVLPFFNANLEFQEE